MGSTTITRMIGFDAGHRLVNHEGRCRMVHGHRYQVEVTCSADSLDSVGRIVDFSVVKTEVGGWIDAYWDHAFIAEENDSIIDWLVLNKMAHYVLNCAPTAENMAAYLYNIATDLLRKHGVTVVNLRLWETPNCFADYNKETNE